MKQSTSSPSTSTSILLLFSSSVQPFRKKMMDGFLPPRISVLGCFFMMVILLVEGRSSNFRGVIRTNIRPPPPAEAVVGLLSSSSIGQHGEELSYGDSDDWDFESSPSYSSYGRFHHLQQQQQQQQQLRGRQRQRHRQVMEDKETDEPTEFSSPSLTEFPTITPTMMAPPAPTRMTPVPPSRATDTPTAILITVEPSVTATSLPTPNEEDLAAVNSSSTGSSNISVSEDFTNEEDVVEETNQRTLLPFSIVVMGSIDDGRSVRVLLQDYLTSYLRGPTHDFEIVETIQLEEIDDGSEGNHSDKRRERRELRIQQHHLIRVRQNTPSTKRILQGNSSNSNSNSNSSNNNTNATDDGAATNWTETVLRYVGQVYLTNDGTAVEDFVDTKPSTDQIQQAQTLALEDTQALQDYFLEAVMSVQDDEQDDGNYDNEVRARDPIVLLQVQVNDRPEVEQDPTATLQWIESGSTMDGNTTEASDGNTNSTVDFGIVGLAIGIAVISVILIGSLYCFWKRKRNDGNKLDALEIISDVNSDDHMDDIVYDKSVLQVAPTKSTESGGGGGNGGRHRKDQSMDELEKDSTSNTPRGSGRLFPFFAAKDSNKDSTSSRAREEENPIASTSLYSGTATEDATGDALMGGMEIVCTSSSAENRRNPVVVDLVTSAKNAREIEGIEEEVPPVLAIPPNGLSQLQAPYTIFQRTSTNPSLFSHDELDSLVAKANINSLMSNDDESMMGFSLASSDGHEKESNSNNQTGIMNNGVSTTAYNVNVIAGGKVAGIHNGSKEPEIAKHKLVHDDDGHDVDDDVEEEVDFSSIGDDDDDVNNENENVHGNNNVISDSSSVESDKRQNPLFAGVQNLLNSSMEADNQSGKKKSISDPKSRWYDRLRRARKERPPAFLSSDSESNRSLDVAPGPSHWAKSSEISYPPNSNGDCADGNGIGAECDDNISIEVEASGAVAILNSPESDDEAQSSYKEEDSVKGSGSSIMSGYSSAQSSDASPIYTWHAAKITDPTNLTGLGYFRPKPVDDDDHRGVLSGLDLPTAISPAPSEEMDAMFSNEMKPSPAAPIVFTADDHSDAPSDERQVVSLSLFHEGRHNNYTSDSNSHGVLMDTSADTDPAVVEYLMKERRNMKQRTRRKRADRKQPPVTMEV